MIQANQHLLRKDTDKWNSIKDARIIRREQFTQTFQSPSSDFVTVHVTSAVRSDVPFVEIKERMINNLNAFAEQSGLHNDFPNFQRVINEKCR